MSRDGAKQLLGQLIQKLPPKLLLELQDRVLYQPRRRALGLHTGPAPLFRSVFFQVRTKCNGMCSFCGASVPNDQRKDTLMAQSLYAKVIDELAEMGYAGEVAYHVNNDPLIFPPLVEFVTYARERLPGAWLQILTNGKALTEAKAEALLQSGINELTINYYNDDFQAPWPTAWKTVREQIVPRFYSEQDICEGIGPDPQRPKLFRFNVYRRRQTQVLCSRAGTAPNKPTKSVVPKGFCEHPFTQFNINTDGAVAKCSADLHFCEPMGNVLEQSVTEIWTGALFSKVREHLLANDRTAMSTCAQCDYHGCQKVEGRASAVLRQVLM